MSRPIFNGQLDIYSISTRRCLRTCQNRADLSRLGSDEYVTFSLAVQNPSERDFAWQQAYVTVDETATLRWGSGRIPAAGRATLHISYAKMKPLLTPGGHTAVWFFDGREVHREQFLLTRDMDWRAVFPIPTSREIAGYRNLQNLRSPYLFGWFYPSVPARYTEYTVDFKADYLPRGTYCCLGNWAFDYSGLKKRGLTEQSGGSGIHAYAGFQKIGDGRMVSIMSFWDIHCQDRSGNQQIISARRLYPEAVIDGGRFWGEGEGARSTAPFRWEARHWYRMHLKCIPGPETSLLEQWVRDLETGEYSLLCRYAFDVPDAVFTGGMAVFLENYLPETAGQVRAMEVSNPKILDADTRQWRPMRQLHAGSQAGLPYYEGSYGFGVSDSRLWMITSGVGGDWYGNGKGKRTANFTFP